MGLGLPNYDAILLSAVLSPLGLNKQQFCANSMKSNLSPPESNFETYETCCLSPPLSASHILYNLAAVPQGISSSQIHGCIHLKEGQFTLCRHCLNFFLWTCPQHPQKLFWLKLHFSFCTAFPKFLSGPDASLVSLSFLLLYLDITFLFLSWDFYIILNISCPIRHALLICLWDQSRLENLQSNYLKWSHATRIGPNSLRNLAFCLLPSTWGFYILIARSQVRTAAPISHSVIFRLSAHFMWWTWRRRTQPWNVGRNLLDFCTGIWTEEGEEHQNDSVRPYGPPHSVQSININ